MDKQSENKGMYEKPQAEAFDFDAPINLLLNLSVEGETEDFAEGEW